MGFYGWFVSAFAAKMFEFIYYAYLVHIKEGIKHGFKLDFKFIGNRLKVALPLIPTKYTNYLINNSDRAVLDIYRGLGSKISLSHIGLYNIAYSFANYFSLFNNSVNSVVSPIYFKLFAKNDANASSLIRHLTLIWFFFVLGAGFILSLWLKEIMMYLYPKPEFSTAYNYSILIIMSLCYRPFMVASIDRAIYNEKTGTILKITLAGGLLNVALNFAIIPFWGIQGAVITSFITYLYIGFAGFYMKEVKKYITESYRPLLIITLLVLTSALAFTLRDIFWQHKLLVSTGVIILYYVLYRVKAKAWIQSLEALRTKN
jgi:O-antigen/teichoic acid export membrane protein